MDSLTAYLHGTVVGEITRLDDGRIDFDFDEEHRRSRNRFVLSQSFKLEGGDVLNVGRAASSGQVPPFFSNLLPEGHLRTYLASLAGVRESREFELLELLGADLPGAVEVRREEGRSGDPRFMPSSKLNSPRALRFSLAGVQLKFSAIERQTGGLTIPAYGVGGDWIVKLPSTDYRHVPENEYSVMSMAGRVGIDVPEMKLTRMAEIEGLPIEVANLEDSEALVLKRFDRVPGRRIHMEDFAQALAQRPADKYNPLVTNTDLAKLVAQVCGEDDVTEFARRLMFNAIVGNGDMHLKNWSLLYPDGRTPELSPAYDFLCTTVYIPDDGLALRLGTARRWRDLSLDDFAAIADGSGVSQATIVDAVVDVAVRFRDGWEVWAKSLPVDDALNRSIANQMATCPAIVSALQ